jgi:hypothetical protein
MRHFPLRELGYAIGFVVLLATLYVGTYYAMAQRGVEPEIDWAASQKKPGLGVVTTGKMLASVSYSFENEWVDVIFGPMHQMDRRLRPEYWQVDDE